MSQGRVLVIEDDEAVARLLATVLRKSGYEVMTAGDGLDGMQKAQLLEPDCIVCDVNLPGADGFHVARTLRDASGTLARTPFVFLTALDDERSRLQGFGVGADVYMTKPFRVGEVVAQIGALVGLARRMRVARETPSMNLRVSEPPALAGAVANMPSVLTLLDMERRTGELVVARPGVRVVVEIAAGVPTVATIAGESVTPLDALRALLTWKEGSFSFRTRDDEPAPEGMPSLGALLLDATRMMDEGAVAEASDATPLSWSDIMPPSEGDDRL